MGNFRSFPDYRHTVNNFMYFDDHVLLINFEREKRTLITDEANDLSFVVFVPISTGVTFSTERDVDRDVVSVGGGGADKRRGGIIKPSLGPLPQPPLLPSPTSATLTHPTVNNSLDYNRIYQNLRWPNERT